MNTRWSSQDWQVSSLTRALRRLLVLAAPYHPKRSCVSTWFYAHIRSATSVKLVCGRYRASLSRSRMLAHARDYALQLISFQRFCYRGQHRFPDPTSQVTSLAMVRRRDSTASRGWLSAYTVGLWFYIMQSFRRTERIEVSTCGVLYLNYLPLTIVPSSISIALPHVF